MNTVSRKPLDGLAPAGGSTDLYVGSSPGSASAEFCSLLAHALHCHSSAVVLFGADGDLIGNDAFGDVPTSLPQVYLATGDCAGQVGVRAPRNSRGDLRSWRKTATRTDASGASISLTMALPDGVTGAITVAGREGGTPFVTADRDLLDHLTTFYASTFETPARREALRLRGDLRTLREQAIQTAESERQRLARELHDDVGHALTTAILSIDMTSRHLPPNGLAVVAVTAARDSLKDCVDRLNEFAFQLRPRVLNDLGLAPALRGLARRVGETSALDVAVVVHTRERRLSDDTELAAFRIVQEALTNALKHARATHITIGVTFAQAFLEVEIRDDGNGFDPATATLDRAYHGHGLLGMRERAELAGGALVLKAVEGLGTTVCARLPVRRRLS